MLIRIISLVILSGIINFSFITNVNADIFIFPQKKPSVFKDIIAVKKITPKEKPTIKKGDFVYPQSKNVKKIDEIKKIDKIKEVKKPNKIKEVKKVENTLEIKKKSSFIQPKTKPKSYKKILVKNEKSQFINQKDFSRLKQVFKSIDSKKWNTANKQAEKIKDKEIKKLIKWMYLKTSGNNASFNDYQVFINNNEEYPRISRLKYLAEHKIILKNTTAKNIIGWFDKNPPLGGMGELKLAEAYLKNGDKNKAIDLLKSGWITADLNKNELRSYRNKFKKFLTSDDHIKRADYLAWNSKFWDVRRMLRYLPKDEKALYNARQILMSNSYGVDTAISNVPSHLRKNTGLEYDRLKWRNRRGRLEQSLEILYENGNKSETDLVRADLWWKQRESITRTLIYKKRYKTAYKVASEHSLSYGPEFAEAEWLAGWIALTFLKSGEYAISHFDNFYNNVGYPISLARGAYWLGKSYKDLGDENNANKYFKESSKFLNTYYGQLSFNEINYGGDYVLKETLIVDKGYEKEFNNSKLIRHIMILNELDKSQYGKDIIKHLANLNVEKGSEILAAKLATKIERYDFAIQISKQASYQKRFFNEFNYPIITTPRKINNKNMPKSELILAIIRQESEFDRRANSYVGARGMMQLMKYTAKLVAKQSKLPYSISRLTSDPEYNIKLGSYYFDSLLKDYNGVYPFAIAAYNAGPNRVKTWRRVNGDPSKNELSYVDWVELIRFKETRNYVQRVLENINVYKFMLEKKPVKINNFFK